VAAQAAVDELLVAQAAVDQLLAAQAAVDLEAQEAVDSSRGIPETQAVCTSVLRSAVSVPRFWCGSSRTSGSGGA